jgi:hypothetical protein
LITLLSKAHFVPEELVEGGKIDGVLLCAYRRQVSLGVDGNVRMVSLVGEERSDPCGSIWSVVVRKLSQGQKVGPIVLLVVAIRTEVLLQGLVHTFCLSIAFRMVSGGEMETDVQSLAKGAEEVGHEFGSAVGSDVGRNAVLREDVEKEQLHQSGGIYGVMRGDEYALFRQAVHDDKDGGESG